MSMIPVDSERFSEFIDKSAIFEVTKQLMKEYLTNWFAADTETFAENMRADLVTVLERYHFHSEFVSITKNFNFDPPMDTVSCTIRISDEEDDCCVRYTAVFDDQLNVMDDYTKG
jgi:hypothetical protein